MSAVCSYHIKNIRDLYSYNVYEQRLDQFWCLGIKITNRFKATKRG